MSAFTNYHLYIDREIFQSRSYAPLEGGRWIAEIPPEMKTYEALLKRVGGPWGWDRRPHDREQWGRDITHPESRLYLLGQHGDVIGYCFSGTVKKDLTDHFTAAMHNRHIVEIKNFGFYPEHTGQGHGQVFLPALFTTYFADYDGVVLTTRSTNHARVVAFYEGLGMCVSHTEIQPDDLRPTPPTSVKRMPEVVL